MLELSTHEVIDRLISWNLPPLPVSPAQDARRYPRANKTGKIERDRYGNPLPLFTGKNPSFLDLEGIPHLLRHIPFQQRLPAPPEILRWFANPLNGVGTLGGWHNIIWLDFDVKRFDSAEECDRVVEKWIATHDLNSTFIERTHSGGWRIGVRVQQTPNFTNFSLVPSSGGRHVGEALSRGRFTVLAPTIGPSGNPYRSINTAYPVSVESLEAIGIYPYCGAAPSDSKVPVSPKSTLQGAPQQRLVVGAPPWIYDTPSSLRSRDTLPSLPLIALLSRSAYYILTHADSYQVGQRSDALIHLAREAFGWQIWANACGRRVTPTAKELCYQAGLAMGLSGERIGRILACRRSRPLTESTPAIYHFQGDIGCWRKVLSLF